MRSKKKPQVNTVLLVPPLSRLTACASCTQETNLKVEAFSAVEAWVKQQEALFDAAQAAQLLPREHA